MNAPYKYHIVDNDLIREFNDLKTHTVQSCVSMNDLVNNINLLNEELWAVRKSFNIENDSLKRKLEEIRKTIDS